MSSIKVIVVPADREQPLRIEELEASDLDHMQCLVGGDLEVINLEEPSCSLFINEDGGYRQLPANERATLLLRVGRPAFLTAPSLVGDAFITGAPDRSGDDTDAPEQLRQVLFDAKYLEVEAQTEEGGPWLVYLSGYDSWEEAYLGAIGLLKNSGLVHAARVVPVK